MAGVGYILAIIDEAVNATNSARTLLLSKKPCVIQEHEWKGVERLNNNPFFYADFRAFFAAKQPTV